MFCFCMIHLSFHGKHGLADFSIHPLSSLPTDTTILPLLCAWGVWDNIWPSYAAMVAIELYQQSTDDNYDDEYLFRLVYAGKELVLPGCDEGR